MPGTLLLKMSVIWERRDWYLKAVYGMQSWAIYMKRQSLPGYNHCPEPYGIVDPDIISVQTPSEEEQQYKERWILNIRKLASSPMWYARFPPNPKGGFALLSAADTSPGLFWRHKSCLPAIILCATLQPARPLGPKLTLMNCRGRVP